MIIMHLIAGYSPNIKDLILLVSALLNIVLAFLVYRKYYFNHTPFVGIKIKKPNKNLPEFKIKIKNTGVIPVELEPPVMIFKKRGNKRLFQVRNGNTVFPLALFRKEEYDFIVDLARFYSTDSSLITYTEAFLEVRDKNQKKIARKRINLRF
jgi:hypothetical protein